MNNILLVFIRVESFVNDLSGAAGESDAVSQQDKRKQNLVDTAITSDKQQQIVTHAVINSALKAVRLDSVNLVGYIQWSFVDGFEFVTQHTQAWGLVGLDWTTPKRKRYIKPFGYWFSDLVESRGFENRDFICESPLPERREIKPVQFKSDFIWATATAATQVGFRISDRNLSFEILFKIEGAWNEDGKGVSIWDTFSRVEGNVLNGDTPDIACDSYHQFERDIQMIKDLGTNSYRFSIAWPRIYPSGRKQDGLNQKGLDWYVHFVERLIQEDIKPLGWFSYRCSLSDFPSKKSNRIG